MDRFRSFQQGLPRPVNYGYMRRDDPVPIRSQELPDVRVQTPDAVERHLANAIPDIPTAPISQIAYGAGNPDVVGLLLNVIKSGQPDPTSGATPELAMHFLTRWGYPTEMGALTGPEWDAKIAQHALDPNPLLLLGG